MALDVYRQSMRNERKMVVDDDLYSYTASVRQRILGSARSVVRPVMSYRRPDS